MPEAFSTPNLVALSITSKELDRGGFFAPPPTKIVLSNSPTTIGLKKTATCDNTSMLPFIRVTDLKEFLKAIFDGLPGERDPNLFDNEIWVLFAGDKGGGSMKFHLEIINSITSGSVDNVHIFCMYEGADTVENMWKVFHVFQQPITDLQEGNFRIEGRRIRVFLGGDFHFLDDVLGHQGSAATYPSSTDLVTLEHLRNHAGKPHNPENCQIDLRTIEHYHLSYNENLCDDRNGGNTRENGKHHFSVVDKMLFPLQNLACVVPPVLHILLGITLLLFNLLLQSCQELDEEENWRDTDQEKNAMMSEWEEASVLLAENQAEFERIGTEIVEMENRMGRVDAMLQGDIAENRRIASQSETGPKRRRRQEKCNSVVCCIMDVDADVTWVQCDNCDNWLHTLCECFNPGDELTVDAIERYVCLKCRNVEDDDLIGILKEKVTDSLAEEDNLKMIIVKQSTLCDELKAKNESKMGPRELELHRKLDEIKVKRQAYHGNVFVGNHCKLVLRHHEALCNVVADKPVLHQTFTNIFSLFSKIQRPLFIKSRLLTQEEITTLTNSCSKFGEIFPSLFPQANVTRKIHELVFSVPRFAQRFKTIGMLSEEEGESLHAAVNMEHRQLVAVRNSSDRMSLIIKRQELRSNATKSLLKRKPRLCLQCKDVNKTRTFLRGGKDGNRYCPQCDPEKF